MSANGAKMASRRSMLRAGAVALAACAASGAKAQQKIDRSLVAYLDRPTGGQQCNKCVYWRPPHACAIVDGAISPTGWCGVFAAKVEQPHAGGGAGHAAKRPAGS